MKFDELIVPPEAKKPFATGTTTRETVTLIEDESRLITGLHAVVTI